MKRLLTAAALIAMAAPAYAGPVINVTGYSLPDGEAFNSVTTTALGVPDTPYSYYTGPVVFHVQNAPDITVYCVDLNHYLKAGLYEYVPLTQNGAGDLLGNAASNRIGNIALLGAAAQAGGSIANLDFATAAQAAIWDIAYSAENAASFTGNGAILADLTDLLGDSFGAGPNALALRPYGQGWYDSPYASQEMVVGLATGVPEMPTWVYGAMGFALMGFATMRRKEARYTI